MQYIQHYDEIMDELQVSIESVRNTLNNVAGVYHDVVALESISRNDIDLIHEYTQGVALEGLDNLPDIRTYTSFPSRTNLSVSTESISNAISNAIAWIIKKVREFGRWIKQKAIAFYNWVRKVLGMAGPKEVPLDEVKDEPVPAADAISGPVAQIEVEKETLVEKVEEVKKIADGSKGNKESAALYAAAVNRAISEIETEINNIPPDLTQAKFEEGIKNALKTISEVFSEIPENLRDDKLESEATATITAAIHAFAENVTAILKEREKSKSSAPDVALTVPQGEDAAPVVKMSVVQECQDILSAPRGKGSISQETTQSLLNDADPVAARNVIAEGMVDMRQSSTLLITGINKAVSLIISGKPEEAVEVKLDNLDFGTVRMAIDRKLQSAKRLQAKLDEMNNNPSQVASYLRNNILKDKAGEVLSKEVQRHIEVQTAAMDKAAAELGKVDMTSMSDDEMKLTKSAIDRISVVAIGTVRQQLSALNHYNLMFAQYEISGKALHAQYQALRKRNKKK